VLAEELATTWLFVEGGRAGDTVVVRWFCRACVPAGPVAELACAVCADGPLLAGELAIGTARQVVEEWLIGQGWRSRGPSGDGVVLCPRCAPVASTAPEPEPDDDGAAGGWRLW
jgi:hypothetical protein